MSASDTPTGGQTALDLELPPDTAPLSRRPTNRLVPWYLVAAGLVVVIIAGWVITDTSATWRTATALAGAVLLWRGTQRLLAARFGPSFRLGFWLAAFWIALVVFGAVFVTLLPLDHFDRSILDQRYARPTLSFDEPLGRDAFGRSHLSRVTYGAQTSLMIGGIAVGVGLSVGIVLGLLAGYFGRAVDTIIGIFANTTLAFPPLILLLAAVAVFSRSITTLALALALLSIPTYTRVMRAQTIAIKQREFVLAARAMGASSRRIMIREIFPNAVLPVASYSFLVLAVTIVAEGSLAFLGLGIPPPRPTWGGMIADGQLRLKTEPHLVFVPATIMFLTVLSFNRIGQWARSGVLGERGDDT